ncbi:diacylglycerol/lipid kinase family protein [Naasia lichenicola]|uniref:Diacylglycerol kinase n=1 Tax=Naasia lichenicola TaxID=2565933 RepID=A0A4S4FHB0_9MICO|nr:diacylglycerol kinase family protein [Naasia lichenicola]THG29368.1 diacylglycerol kinase [Naasia lichenicola]
MPPRGTTTSTAAIVYNPLKVNFEHLRSAIAVAEADAGWGRTRFYETSAEDAGQGMTKQALADGADIVMAAGGDGTVRAVAEALRGTGVPISLIPSGTGNLLARNLNLTLVRVEESVSTAFTGVVREIDLGIVEIERVDGGRDSHVFLVMAGLGLDARMIANTNPELKRRVGWLAYVDAIARSLRGGNNVRLRFSLDGQAPRQLRVNTILIGNCGSLPPNILLLPEAAIDDGLFDIVALRPDGFFGWMQIWVKIVWENGVLRRSSVGRKLMSFTREVRTLRYLKGREIVIRPEEPQEFQLDGDTFGQVKAVRSWVDPLALKVMIPSTEADRLPASDEAKAKQSA